MLNLFAAAFSVFVAVLAFGSSNVGLQLLGGLNAAMAVLNFGAFVMKVKR